MKISLQCVFIFMLCVFSIAPSPRTARGSDDDDVERTALEDLDETSLDILLIGTAPGDVENGFAIILDKSSNIQVICRVGDFVQGAEIRQVYREKVVLEVNGEPQLLSFTAQARVEIVPAEQALAETESAATDNIIGYAPEVFIQRDKPPVGQPDKKMPVRRIIFKSKQKVAP